MSERNRGPNRPQKQEPAASAKANGLIENGILSGFISQIAQASESDKADIAMVDRLILALITRHCAFGFQDAAVAIGKIVGRNVAHRLALICHDPERETAFYLNQAQGLLQSFEVIGATGYLPTAREAMCEAIEIELARISLTFHEGGLAQ